MVDVQKIALTRFEVLLYKYEELCVSTENQEPQQYFSFMACLVLIFVTEDCLDMCVLNTKSSLIYVHKLCS